MRKKLEIDVTKVNNVIEKLFSLCERNKLEINIDEDTLVVSLDLNPLLVPKFVDADVEKVMKETKPSTKETVKEIKDPQDNVKNAYSLLEKDNEGNLFVLTAGIRQVIVSQQGNTLDEKMTRFSNMTGISSFSLKRYYHAKENKTKIYKNVFDKLKKFNVEAPAPVKNVAQVPVRKEFDPVEDMNLITVKRVINHRKTHNASSIARTIITSSSLRKATTFSTEQAVIEFLHKMQNMGKLENIIFDE